MCDLRVMDGTGGATNVCGGESNGLRDVLGRVQQCCLGGAEDVVYSGVRCRRRRCGDVFLGGRVWESGF